MFSLISVEINAKVDKFEAAHWCWWSYPTTWVSISWCNVRRVFVELLYEDW